MIICVRQGQNSAWPTVTFSATQHHHKNNTKITRMRAYAQRDGRPSECRWRPLFNAANFGWRPLLECHAVTLPRYKTRWNLLGCPKLANRSQLIVGWSSPHCEDMWRRHCLFNKFFFPIVDMCPSCEDIARQSCAMVPRWRIFGDVDYRTDDDSNLLIFFLRGH